MFRREDKCEVLPIFFWSQSEKESTFKKLQEELRQLSDIKFALLHGSFLENRAFHDIDVAVYFDERLANDSRLNTCISLSTKLTAGLSIPVDIHELNSASLSFCYHATQGKILLFQDREEVYQYKENIWIKYMDFYPFLKQNLLDLLEI